MDSGKIVNAPVTVKISGDGAPFSRCSSLILLSFSLPFLSDQALSGEGKLYYF